MSIKQINASFLVNEDRILFRFNTLDQAEYRLWLTRRVTLFILAATAHLLTKNLEQKHTHDAAKALTEFENKAISDALKTAHAGAQSYESGTHFPIGFDPLLVMDVTCSLLKDGDKSDLKSIENEQHIDDAISIDFLLSGGANLNLKLPANMTRAMSVLLDQLRQEAGWGEAVLSIKNQSNIHAESDAENEDNLPNQTPKNISLH